MAWTQIWLCVQYDLGDMIIGQGHETPLGHWQQMCEVITQIQFSVSNMKFGFVCKCHLELRDTDMTL